jgi:uncharacterized membrane protein
MNTHRRNDAHTAPDDEIDEVALRAEVDAELEAERAAHRFAGDRVTGAVLLVGGLAGWIASLMLTIDEIYLAGNPGGRLGCDVNPFISCGTVMMTWQAGTFGIPNMTIGLGGFAIMGAIGSLLLSGTRLPRWFEGATLGGTSFAFAFVHWLAISAIFVIHALCPWCMVVWAATAPMFFSTLARTLERRRGTTPPRGLTRILRHWVTLSVAWYVLVVVVIALAFLPQWLTVLGLD